MNFRLIIQSLIIGRASAFVHRSQKSLAYRLFSGTCDIVKDHCRTTNKTRYLITQPVSQLQRKMSTGTNNEKITSTSETLLFGKFRISKSQIFYRSPSGLSAAIVNLRPIVPGHVLVIPIRVVQTLSDLTDDEYNDLWRSVRRIQNALKEHYGAGGFNVAVQDGKVAGQSVPHVHVHILPRKADDFERNDDIYDHLEDWAPTESMSKEKRENKVELDVPEDEDRKDRTMKMMEDECLIYKTLLGTEANI